MFYIFTDPSTLYQDFDRTTPVTGNGEPIGSATDLSGNNNTIYKATTAAKPTMQTGAYFDGVDDELRTADFAAGTLGSNMDCFMAVRRASLGGTAFLGYMTPSQTAYFGAHAQGAAPLTSSNSGSVYSYVVDGSAVSGGASATRGQLSAALPVGQSVVLEARNLNLSTWTRFSIGWGGGLPFNGTYGALIVCPAQTSEVRTRVARYLAEIADEIT